MSFSAIQAAVKNQLEQAPDLLDRVSISDEKKLNTGTNKAAVISYLGMNQQRIAEEGLHSITWRLLLALYVRYKNDDQVTTDMVQLRQDVIDRFNKYPRLGGVSGVFDSLVIEGVNLTRRQGGNYGEVAVIGGVKFFHEELIMEVQEDVSAGELE